MHQLTRRTFLAGTATALAAPTLGTAARADTYPSKPISYIVPYAPGGASDVIARLLADKIFAQTGQRVVVDYKQGAAGVIGANFVAKAPPDGYTIMAGTNSFFTVIPRVQTIAYDPEKDLVGVAMCGEAFMPMAVSKDLPVSTVAELVEYAKKNPGKVSFASSGIGTIGHLSSEYLKLRTGARFLHVPYSGGAAAMNAVLSGEAKVCVDTGSVEFIKDGRLKPLAMLGKKRWDQLPQVPTVEEAGVADWALRSWHTVLVPGQTPPDVVKALNGYVNTALASADVLEKLKAFGLEPQQLSPAEVAARIKADQASFTPILDEAGLGKK